MIGRLRHLFVHELLPDKRYFFAEVQKVVQGWRKDEVLNLPMLRLSGETEMIGLPGIMSERMYMLSVAEEDEEDGRRLRLEGDDVLWVDWPLLIM